MKIGVWYAVIGSIFFNDTGNYDRYRKNIVSPFFQMMSDKEREYGYFQQDSATAHAADSSLDNIKAVFDNSLISRGLWPARSSGTLKNKVQATVKWLQMFKYPSRG